MKKINLYLFIATLNLLMLAYSCNSENKNDQTQHDEKVESAGEKADSMVNAENEVGLSKMVEKSLEEEKIEFSEKINHKLENINLHMKELKQKAKKEKGETLKEINKELEELKAQQKELSQELEALKKQSKDNWEAFKKALNEKLEKE